MYFIPVIFFAVFLFLVFFLKKILAASTLIIIFGYFPIFMLALRKFFLVKKGYLVGEKIEFFYEWFFGLSVMAYAYSLFFR